jgi:thiamine kinase
MKITLAEVLDDWPLWGLTKKPVEDSQVKVLKGGLTNLCYQLSLESGEYVIRIGAENTQALGINRQREKSIHQLVSSLQFTSALRYCDEEDRYWIRDYIEGEILGDNESEISDSSLIYMVEQLKALHQIPVDLSLPRVNISDKADAYWSILETKKVDAEMLKMKALMQVAMNEPPEGEFCLCHLDPVPANWLYTSKGLQLLDWEYAGLGHPLWDLAALLQGIVHGMRVQCNNNVSEALSNAEVSIEQRIIELYGIENPLAWRRAKVQMEYLSSLWYKAQS